MRWLVAGVMMSALVGGTAVAAPIMPAGVVDTTTQGNWIGIYGQDGYILAGFNGESGTFMCADNASLPSYISSYSIGPMFSYTWEKGTSNPYDLQSPDGSSRSIGCWYTFDSDTITMVPSQSQTFNLSVYLRDYGDAGRWDNLSFTGAGLEGTDTVEVTAGKWITYTVTAAAGTNIELTLGKQVGVNGVISALMFSPVPEPASLAMLILGGLPMVIRRRRV